MFFFDLCVYKGKGVRLLIMCVSRLAAPAASVTTRSASTTRTMTPPMKLGRNPTRSEMAKQLDMSEREFEVYL